MRREIVKEERRCVNMKAIVCLWALFACLLILLYLLCRNDKTIFDVQFIDNIFLSLFNLND